MTKYEVTIRFEAINATDAIGIAEDAFRDERVDYMIVEAKVSR